MWDLFSWTGVGEIWRDSLIHSTNSSWVPYVLTTEMKAVRKKKKLQVRHRPYIAEAYCQPGEGKGKEAIRLWWGCTSC